jgi:hypothetical protein
MIINWRFRTIWEQTNGADFYAINKKTYRRNSNLEIMFYGFPKDKIYTWANSRKDGMVHSWYTIDYPIILFFFVYVYNLNQIHYWSMLIG